MAGKTAKAVDLEDDFEEEEIKKPSKKEKKSKTTEEKPAEPAAEEGGETPKQKRERLKLEKKEKKQKKKEEKGEGGVRFLPVFLGIVVTLIAVLAVVIAFNPFGLRDKYLADTIAKVPVLNNIVKKEETPPQQSREEMTAEIVRLTKQTETQNNTIKELQESADNYKGEIESLRDMERQMTEFKAQKEEFDKAVAAGDRKAFAKWYEGVNPELAQVLYKEALGENAKDKAVADYMGKIKGMDAKSIAAAFETIKGTDMELIIGVMNKFDQETASGVLNAMQAETAGTVIRQMEPKSFATN